MIKANQIVDAKGLSCPMPIVKTKKAMNDLESGQVIEVQATDKGSTADIKAWAESTGHQYLGTIEEGDILKHYIRKETDKDTNGETKFPNVVTNEELQALLENNEEMVIVDVRESAEYAFGHIPGAKSIPLGELEERMGELNQSDVIYVVCRTGTRSDLAAQKLSENGFKNVYNVVPGMSKWTGRKETTQK
ncbi:sulfurtransferase TusA family protein [Bacillus alveayuensis]|jgi:rhodanese-related sulfurtransferase/TusA-related sulfurtransferase|uniref:Rhodanese-related sulfurtransferase/TusA-related sulfurtransferase n=1 Tax=Aeribacillus alveayuensis TaxID=279215 RepID=A0ABT9VMT5_9BACI|nr:sulfurtransferase TusA family protein [Bacillus alveayuensis]MDQ0162152.1 rhodanese-related sulfurtransferase/TusA-related sulfurtransferase [Bacillus alveayuensis]